MGDGLLVHEVTSHEDVVHVAAPEQELVSQHALDNEAAGLIQPSRAGVATQHAQAQLACAAPARLLDSGLNERSSGPEALPAGVNCQPIDVQHVLARRECAGSTELGVPDYKAVDHGDENVVRPCALVEEPSAGGWRGGGGDVVGPGGGVELAESHIVPELGTSNRYHPDRMPQIRRLTTGPHQTLDDAACAGTERDEQKGLWIQYPRVAPS